MLGKRRSHNYGNNHLKGAGRWRLRRLSEAARGAEVCESHMTLVKSTKNYQWTIRIFTRAAPPNERQ
ncbi:hypothetical protein AV530_011750 [Patagioenas fasciata monilis]|uniref:Uncharacterized protein n=1 Tax=Patagioenas fasciata monilis TaxID=372326 RepID=A0A1V4KLM7_PATFA|nr:hypothetical protein AV530_011750 [Patagioenas fasciata monilis]